MLLSRVACVVAVESCLADNQRVRAVNKARNYKERIEKCRQAKAERLVAEKARRRIEDAEWARRNRMQRLQAREERMLQAAKDALRQQREELEAQQGACLNVPRACTCIRRRSVSSHITRCHICLAVAASDAAAAEAREASRPTSTKKLRKPKAVGKPKGRNGAPGGRSKKKSPAKGGGAGRRKSKGASGRSRFVQLVMLVVLRSHVVLVSAVRL